MQAWSERCLAVAGHSALMRGCCVVHCQAYETAGEAVEAREEAEMLRLQLDCAREEREGALRAAAAAQACLALKSCMENKKPAARLRARGARGRPARGRRGAGMPWDP